MRPSMAWQAEATARPPRLPPRSSAEASVGIAEPDHPEPGSASNLDEEISDFITRHVIEKDAQFFDG